MSKPVVLLPAAVAELRVAAERYEALVPDLGRAFLGATRAALSTIEGNPALYTMVLDDIRRAPIRRFPFGIFYLEELEVSRVLAVLDLRRDPVAWRAQLRQRIK